MFSIRYIKIYLNQVFGVEEEKQEDGKVFKKMNLGDYQWKNYREAYQISTNFGKGLRKLGQEPKTPIAIYAETREEWILAALGAFSQSIIVSTVYTNLGDDAICHGFNETEVGTWDLTVPMHVIGNFHQFNGVFGNENI